MPARQLRQPQSLGPQVLPQETDQQAPDEDLSRLPNEDLSPDAALSAQSGLGNAGVAAMLTEQLDLGGEDPEAGGGALGGFAWWEGDALEAASPGTPDLGGGFPVSLMNTASSAPESAGGAQPGAGQAPASNALKADGGETNNPLGALATAHAHQRIPAFNGALPEAAHLLQAQHQTASETLPTMRAPTGLAPQEAPPKPAPFAPIEAAPLTLPQGRGTPGEDTHQVRLSGEADPGRMADAQLQADAALSQASAQASTLLSQERGERHIAPVADPEPLRAALSTQTSNLTQSPIPETHTLPPELLAGLDAQATPLLDGQLAAPLAQASDAQRVYADGAQAAHARADADIWDAEDAAISTQEAAQERAQAQVSAAREETHAQLQAVSADAQAQAQAEHQTQTQAIQAEAQSANAEARAHLEAAEQEAAALSAEAEREAAAEQSQAEEGGLLDMAADAARAVVDGLKATVNAIYEGLRAAVAALFEAAQALASGVIELAQRAIVGLIALYAEALKSILDVALAAFPELAEALHQRIDGVVAQATALVQGAADLLKRGVVAALGLLADTIDQLLALSQSFYNAAFGLVGMALNGEWRALLQGLEGLVDASAQAPPQLEAAAYEELLGGDLSQPLSAAELEMAGLTSPEGPAGQHIGPPWTIENVGVDAVLSDMVLSPEVSAELLAETGGDGIVDFGWSEDPTRSLDHILGLEAQNKDHSAYDDGLSVRERASAKWTILKDSLATWWSANWPTVLGVGVLGVGGFIAANLLTGGAVLAALPPLMAVVGPLFMGMMAAQVGGHLSDFLSKGWAGDAQGGGKSLARALAVGAIELATAATFKVGSVALKGAKTMAKGAAKGARSLTQGAAKGASKLAAKGTDYALNNGKVLLGGVDDARVGQRARSLDALGGDLANKTRFKGYRIRVQGGRFELEGKINPWILLANGKVEWKEDDALKRLQAGSGDLRMGEGVSTLGDDAMEGVVVGLDRVNKGALVESLENLGGAVERRAADAAALGVDGDDILPMYKHLTQADMPGSTVGERAAKLGLSDDAMRQALREQGEGTLTRMGQRSDEELLYALKAGQHEVADGGHSLLRHGPDVTDEALKRRLTEGVAPDLAPTKRAPGGSTQFNSYEEWLYTREKAIEAIEAGKSSAKQPLDLSLSAEAPPNPAGVFEAKTTLEYATHPSNVGHGHVGEPLTTDGQKRVPVARADGTEAKVWPNTEPVDEGVNRVLTTIAWDDTIKQWKVVQHFPVAAENSFDAALKTYKSSESTPDLSL